ncbi:MAG TPA: hypothetical protein VGG60_12340 [Candidatus Binataceae bacterium]
MFGTVMLMGAESAAENRGGCRSAPDALAGVPLWTAAPSSEDDLALPEGDPASPDKGCGDTLATTGKREPHSPQNLALGGLDAPHREHLRASAAPHSRQNFASSGF